MTPFRTIRIETLSHPLGPDLRTVTVPVVLEARLLKDAAELALHPIWASSKLTAFGRDLPKKRRFKARELRQPGEAAASALVVWFAKDGQTERQKKLVFPGKPIWEDQMTFILVPGAAVSQWQGDIETACQRYVDTLVSPSEFGPNRAKQPLTQEELQAYRDRAAAAFP